MMAAHSLEADHSLEVDHSCCCRLAWDSAVEPEEQPEPGVGEGMAPSCSCACRSFAKCQSSCSTFSSKGIVWLQPEQKY